MTWGFSRAEDGIRTRDSHLGQVVVSWLKSASLPRRNYPSTRFPLGTEFDPVVERPTRQFGHPRRRTTGRLGPRTRL